MTDRKKPTAGFWITVALVAVLIGYPLSIGPAAWAADNGYISEPFYVAVYAPLWWLGERSEEVANFLYWYVVVCQGRE